MIKVLNENNFKENTKNGIKLVSFTAPWCGFCQKQKPVLEEIAQNDIWIGDVNADENPALVRQFNISAFPAFILLKDGKPIGEFSGYRTKYDLLNTVLKFIEK